MTALLAALNAGYEPDDYQKSLDSIASNNRVPPRTVSPLALEFFAFC
jgi:hypothetical protein